MHEISNNSSTLGSSDLGLLLFGKFTFTITREKQKLKPKQSNTLLPPHALHFPLTSSFNSQIHFSLVTGNRAELFGCYRWAHIKIVLSSLSTPLG